MKKCACFLVFLAAFFSSGIAWLWRHEFHKTFTAEVTEAKIGEEVFDLSGLSDLLALIERVTDAELSNLGFLGNPKIKIVVEYDATFRVSDLKNLFRKSGEPESEGAKDPDQIGAELRGKDLVIIYRGLEIVVALKLI
jgi:hypothetical protein